MAGGVLGWWWVVGVGLVQGGWGGGRGGGGGRVGGRGGLEITFRHGTAKKLKQPCLGFKVRGTKGCTPKENATHGSQHPTHTTVQHAKLGPQLWTFGLLKFCFWFSLQEGVSL